ncbi:transposase [Kyrpidia sp.]|uniref:transposase n=1 Tax=Kyrpidia sp. TaxID=2073077 RepID=UPI00258F5F13|nr:transposase [Kyrpidia sp.]MCL6577290.1 transposase [Kyrpidia sp.]
MKLTHKERNILERLPEKPRDWVKRQLRGTWRQETEKESLVAPRRLAAQLEKAYPGTAASLREGMGQAMQGSSPKGNATHGSAMLHFRSSVQTTDLSL